MFGMNQPRGAGAHIRAHTHEGLEATRIQELGPETGLSLRMGMGDMTQAIEDGLKTW